MRRDEMFHSDTYYGADFSDGLKHWKYVKREKVNGKWRYYYTTTRTMNFSDGTSKSWTSKHDINALNKASDAASSAKKAVGNFVATKITANDRGKNWIKKLLGK